MSKLHDFWIFEALEPRIFSFHYTKILQTIQENRGGILENILPYLNYSKIQNFDMFWKDGHRQMMKVRPQISWKSWICISYLSKDMRWKFGNMYQISFDPTGHQTCNIFVFFVEIWWVQTTWYLQAFSKIFGRGIFVFLDNYSLEKS